MAATRAPASLPARGPPGLALLHVLPGRMRIRVDALQRNPALEQDLARGLRSVPGIQRVKARALTGTCLVEHDSRCRAEHVLDTLATALRRHQAQPQRARARRRRGAEEDSTGWHVLEVDDVVAHFRVDPARGLDDDDAEHRCFTHGPNAIPPAARRSPWRVLGAQLAQAPVALLCGSAVLSVATGGLLDGAAIASVLALNAAIGFITEMGTERILSGLDGAERQDVMVLRSGERKAVDFEDVCPGDVLVLSRATWIAADARVVQSERLTVDESLLTGESVPVAKTRTALEREDAPLGDRSPMVFRGSVVTGGEGLAVVVATGPHTEMGRVQALTENVNRRTTPLERQLGRLGLQLAVGSGAVCAGVFGLGLLRRRPPLELLKTSITLAVAAVPEGLPTVAVTTLALGIRRMRARSVLIRSQDAVETLGAVSALCLDKTGTLTENRMEGVRLVVGSRAYDLEADGPPRLGQPGVERVSRVLTLCHQVSRGDGNDTWEGSPTERALVALAEALGADVAADQERFPLLTMRARSEARSWMATFHEGPDARLLVVKGRPEDVITRCSRHLVWEDGRAVLRPVDDAVRDALLAENQRMAKGALRVLALADGDREDADLDSDLTYLGLVGMADPVRQGVRALIRRFHASGIKTVMLTGDQGPTARAVARRVGMPQNGDLVVMDAERLSALPGPELDADVVDVEVADVWARISPADKLRVVQALQARGHVVAMTGDGVNDSPALRQADVGIALGEGGAAAARSAADVVLADDDLERILGAVQQGRTLYDDIRKAVRFILATNLSEVLLTVAVVAHGRHEPLSPLQLLWINLLTDVFPELALAVQPAEGDVLERAPRDVSSPMFTRRDLGRVGVEGTLVTAAALGAMAYGTRRYGPGPRTGTLGFTSLTSAQLLHALAARSEHRSLFAGEGLDNPWLAGCVSGGLALQVAASTVPGLRRLLGTVPLSRGDWLLCGGAALAPLLLLEAAKAVRRWRRNGGGPSPSVARPRRR